MNYKLLMRIMGVVLFAFGFYLILFAFTTSLTGFVIVENVSAGGGSLIGIVSLVAGSFILALSSRR